MSPFLIGITIPLFVACQRENPPTVFRQITTSSGVTESADAVEMSTETMPKTVDSLEVSAKEIMTIDIHMENNLIVMGSTEAPYTLRMYEDYDCYYCREFGTSDLPWLLQTYVANKKLKIERVISTSTPTGILMTKIALCSQKQDLFSETDSALHTRPLTKATELPLFAKKLKLNLASLQTCIASKETAAILKTHTEQVLQADVQRFPAFELGSDHWIGVLTRDELKVKMENL